MSAEPISSTPPASRGPLIDRLRSGPVMFWLWASLIQLPLLTMYLLWMWRFEHYQYIPVLLIAVAALVWSRLTLTIRFPDSRFSGGLLILSQMLLLSGSFLNSSWFASVSFFLLAASFLVTHRLAYLSVPLLLLIRLPLNSDVNIITALQSLTTRLASYVLDLLSVPHLARGNVLELADRELFVAEACSGVQSAFTIAFVALMIAAWRRRPLALIPLYLGIALLWAVLCNTIRVTAIAYAAARLQWDLSTGAAHDVLGYGTLLLAFLLTLSTDSLLSFLFHPVSEANEGEPNPLVMLWDWCFPDRAATPSESIATDPIAADLITPEASGSRWRQFLFGSRSVATIAILALGGVSLLPLTVYALAEPAVVKTDGRPLLEPAANMLDDIEGPVRYQFSEKVRGGTDPRLGMHADQWTMNFGHLTGRLVFSQPYPEWHELTVCYAGQGWVLDSVRLLQPRSTAMSGTKVKYATLQRSDGALGYLIYSGLNADGSVIDPPEDSMIGRMRLRCQQLISGRGQSGLSVGDCAMLQMWIVSPSPITPDHLSTIADSIAEVRDRFAAQLVATFTSESGFER